MERRLTAIPAADVVGYGRLMGSDEAGTFAQLTEARAEVVDRIIAQHLGRVVKQTGDGVLAEFPSVVNAVACAVGLQRRMGERSGALFALGEKVRAKEWTSRAMAIDPDDPIAQYNAVGSYSRLGEIEMALDLLERCLPGLGHERLKWAKDHSSLDALRTRERDKKLYQSREGAQS